jgi:DNA-binding transcriptional regulator LsrR (DeoR family)
MKNIKSDTKKVARRHMSIISSSIFQELYEIYPKSITLKSLAKNLDLREKTIKSTINKAIKEGVPIEISLSASNEVIYKADPSEPISYILKEKQSAEEMLKLIQAIPSNGNEEANRKRNNNNRIYEEYVSTLNDLLDKWTSLRLVDNEDRIKSID